MTDTITLPRAVIQSTVDKLAFYKGPKDQTVKALRAALARKEEKNHADDVLKDAQRYRWLRESDSEEASVMTYMEGFDEWLAYASAESVDMAIDSAMEVEND